MRNETQAVHKGTSKKQTDRVLSKLRGLLDSGNMSAVESILAQEACSDLLTRIREQKLLLRPPLDQRTAFAGLLLAASKRAARDPVEFENYIAFTIEVDTRRRECIERLVEILHHMPPCSKADLLVSAERVCDWCSKEQSKRIDLHSGGVSVAENERRLHDLNGAVVDIVMAVARLVNEYSRIVPQMPEARLNQAQRRQAVNILQHALTHAAEANSLEWLFDSVTYGEFTVEQLIYGPAPAYRFHFVDAKRYLLKSLAIRRSLVIKFSGHQSPRYMREKLDELKTPLLEQAVRYYARRTGVSEHATIDLTRARQSATLMLRIVDAKDDLLVAASQFDARTLAYYFVAIAMRWYCLAAGAMRDAPKAPRRRWLESPCIPLREIVKRIGGVDEELLGKVVEDLTVELPARSHVSVADRPFVRDRSGVARPFLGGEVGTWTCIVRKALIQGGAVGKSVGAVWEDFYAQSFDGTDWKVIGRGVKLRDKGQILTDVDLLLLRNDLLLVVQIKALIGIGDSPYDHWRNRQTIQYGCFQARIATTYFEANPQSLVAVCGKRLAAGVKNIQPVVLTNIDQLEGWRVEDVPVIGESTRKAICRGALVDYRSSRSGEVIHTHHFVKHEDLTTASILELLQEPIELRIAAEGSETTHSTHSIGGLTLLLPEFVARHNANGLPAHEPNPLPFMAGD